MSSSVLSGDSPLSSHAGSPGSTAHIEEDVIMDDNASAISTTTERLHDMDLTANPIVTPSPPEPTASTEGEENNVISNAPPPVAKPPTLTEVLKKVLLKKENAQIAYLRALNDPDVNGDEADQLRDSVLNLDKQVKALSDGLKAAAATSSSLSSIGLKILKRDLPKFQLEDNKAKPFPNEEAYRSVDHFLSEFEKIVYSSGQDIENVWRKYIPLTLSYELDDWMKTAVMKCNVWRDVKLVFSKKFGTVVSRIHKRRAVMNLEIGFNEFVDDEYSNRFFRTVGEAGYHRDDMTIGDVFLLSLPEPWQLNICTVLLSNTKRQTWTTTKIHNAAVDLLGEKTTQSLLIGKDAKRKFGSEKIITATSGSSTALPSTIPKARMLGDRNLPNKATTKSPNPCRHCGRCW
ncbi:hypothetical protein G6F42_023368 [Rhizopus arrhizus]|nr:hypothetical protein G6F42_023368 [Rhizopus arrhizus]